VSVPVLDLFAGAGGLSSGLTQAGFAPVGAVEAMEDAASTYEALHGIAVDRRRLESIPAAELVALRGRVPVVAGGPPCQPWSTGGLRRGHADERDGFTALFRALDLIRPQAFVIENVAGLERGRTRRYLREILAVLRDELGYTVCARTLNAADFGVPQQRLRLFMVGLRHERFAFPEPTHGPGRPRPWRTAGEVLTPEPFGEPNPSIVTYAKRPDLRPSPYDGLLFNGGGRPINLGAPARTILASAGGNKTPFVDTLGIVPDYHQELLDGAASRSGIVPGARRITVDESAALQSFAPGTRFHGKRSTQYTLVGNAVPPRLARAVGEAVRAALV
jgi:DNA (cytosine-5)-methyltransferase 1